MYKSAVRYQQRTQFMVMKRARQIARLPKPRSAKRIDDLAAKRLAADKIRYESSDRAPKLVKRPRP